MRIVVVRIVVVVVSVCFFSILCYLVLKFCLFDRFWSWGSMVDDIYFKMIFMCFFLNLCFVFVMCGSSVLYYIEFCMWLGIVFCNLMVVWFSILDM